MFHIVHPEMSVSKSARWWMQHCNQSQPTYMFLWLFSPAGLTVTLEKISEFLLYFFLLFIFSRSQLQPIHIIITLKLGVILKGHWTPPSNQPTCLKTANPCRVLFVLQDFIWECWKFIQNFKVLWLRYCGTLQFLRFHNIWNLVTFGGLMNFGLRMPLRG